MANKTVSYPMHIWMGEAACASIGAAPAIYASFADAFSHMVMYSDMVWLVKLGRIYGEVISTWTLLPNIDYLVILSWNESVDDVLY